MKLRILLPALLILFPLVLAGCWDYEEYEDMIQVMGIGIDFDKKTQEITLSVQYVPTTKQSSGTESSGSSSPNKEVVHTAKAKTLYEALAKIQQVVFKKLFYGYLRVIVIGEEAAKYNLLDIIELLDRTPAVRSTAYLVFTSGKAEDTISTFDAGIVASSSEEIFRLANLGGSTGAAYPISVINFTEMLAVPGIEATAPRVITVSKKPQLEAKGGTAEGIKFDVEREGDHRVAGLAAFKGGKLVGWLDEQESLGYGWITGKKVRAYKVSETPDGVDKEDIFYYRVSKSKGKIKVQLANDKPEFQVDVKVVADLRKYHSNDGEFLTPKAVSIMEKKLSKSITTDIKVALKRGQQELKSDIFGFGFALFREDPKLWRSKYEKKWAGIFPDIPVKINVDAKIINTGTNLRRLDVK